MTYPDPAIRWLLLAFVLIAATTDLKSHKLPNWLTVTGLLCGLALNLFLYDVKGLSSAGYGLGLALLVYFPLFLLRAMAAGDAKMMMAIGSLVGPWNWLGIFVISILVGAPLALLVSMSRRRLAHTFSNMAGVLRSVFRFQAPFKANPELDVQSGKGLSLPHGAVVALAVVVFLAMGATQSR